MLKVAEEAAGKRNNNARLSYKDMFHLYDVDNSGEIDFDEFCGVIKTLHLDLRQYHLLKFFSKNAGADGSMNEVEFQDCMQYIEDVITSQVLYCLGMSSFNQTTGFVKALLLVCFFMIFIFLGVAAFAQGGVVGMMVNSVLPMVAILSVDSGNDDDEETAASGSDDSYERQRTLEIVKGVMAEMGEEF